MKYLGTKFYGHDSSIFYLDNIKKKVFAISTERLTRIKHDDRDISPLILAYLKNEIKKVHFVSQGYKQQEPNPYRFYIVDIFRLIIKPKFYSDIKNLNSLVKFWKFFIFFFKDTKNFILYFFYKINKNFFNIKKRIFNEKILSNVGLRKFIKKTLSKCGFYKSIEYWDHHLCHAASAYYFSNFNKKRSLSLTIDGYGDGVFSSLYEFKGKEINFLHDSKAKIFSLKNKKIQASIGFVYSSFTEALGFRKNSDEGKVEALAAFGKLNKKLYHDLYSSILITENGLIFNERVKFFYDLSYLKRIINKIGKENVACTVQKWLEKIIVLYLKKIYQKYKCSNLCLSGGVAANVIMNMKIFEKTKFKNLYIFPAMADDGIAAGAAILSALKHNEDISWLGKVDMPYFGPSISNNEITKAINLFKNINSRNLGKKIYVTAAKSLANKKVIAFVQGRMEFGPRALGNRSILANPFNKATKDYINSNVKKRPSFQPFCPSVLEEDRKKYFEKSYSNKHMTIAFKMRDKYTKIFPSAVHIDGTGRPQFVTKKRNEKFYKVLKEFKKITGYGILINTSFNLHGRSMVNTAYDAIKDFLDCNLDELYIGEYLIKKNRWKLYRDTF